MMLSMLRLSPNHFVLTVMVPVRLKRYLFIVRLDALAVEVVVWHVVGVIGLEVVATGQHGNKQ